MFAFAAAGTGGHLYPALAVADRLVADGADRSSIVFFGGDRLEKTLVPQSGYELVQVPLIALRRSAHPANLKIPFVVARASRRVRYHLLQRRVRVLLALGGYATIPARYAVRRTATRLMVHEQNAIPGLANRLAARHADRVFVAFAAAEGLPGAEVVGNPLRACFSNFDKPRLRVAARRRYGLPAAAAVIGVMGGSQGAVRINEMIPAVARRVGEGAAVVHLAGAANIGAVSQAADGAPVPWSVLPFEDRMDEFYAACDLVVSRGGAVTVSELAATGTPAVIVPLATGPGGEQNANAAVLASAGGAEVVPQEELACLPDVVARLLGDRPRLEGMARAARGAARPDATAMVAGAMWDMSRG